MLNVYICEDDQTQLKKICEIVEQLILIEEFNMCVKYCGGNPNELLIEAKGASCCGIYILDVNLGTTVNGIELAASIREIDPRGFIMFITTESEMSPLTFRYKVEALDYIIKDDFDSISERVRECLLNVNAKLQKNCSEQSKIYTVHHKGETIYVPVNDIILFETSDHAHKVKLYTEDQCIEFYSGIKEIINDLDNAFYHCHRSFLINISKIDRIDKKEKKVYFYNGQSCDVVGRKMKELERLKKGYSGLF